MKPARRYLARIAAALLSGTLCGVVLAQDTATTLAQGGDPRIPESLKTVAPEASPRGAALNELVRRKLRANFDAVDVTRSGRVTRQQARTGRWSVLADHFDEIDPGGRGEVSFEDVMRYLERNRVVRETAR